MLAEIERVLKYMPDYRSPKKSITEVQLQRMSSKGGRENNYFNDIQGIEKKVSF
jgi:hypothetical protein